MQTVRKQSPEPVPKGFVDKRLLNVKEAAHYLGVKVNTLRKKTRLREFPFVKVGGSVRFDVRALDLYIEQHTIKAVD